VIGAHGAGLANVVFCSNGIRVIELATPNWWNPSFSALAQEMSLNHKVIPLKVDGLTSHGNAMEALQALKGQLNN
jgi:capsular polysaccharide biosynthesis protein